MDTNTSRTRTFNWGDLLDIEWRLRPYEAVVLVFAGICILLQRRTPLPYSIKLAELFVMHACRVAVMVLALASALTAGKVLIWGLRRGWKGVFQAQNAVPILMPYVSLNFLLLTIRRSLSIFAVIFFFLHLKHVILWVHTANFDEFFWNLDRWLHGGVQPNVWAMEQIGKDHDLALFLDWSYVKYFDYKILVSSLFLFEPKGRRLADLFFTTYSLLWALGGLSYLIAPTDGPCYALLLKESTVPMPGEKNRTVVKFPLNVAIPPDYVETYREAKIWNAKIYQEKLWEHRRAFLAGEKLPGHFYGIAAMPSLHVAATAMMAFFLTRIGALTGLLGIIYALLTFTGSVFLQWHYAIDGYAGLCLAGLSILLARIMLGAIGKTSAVAAPISSDITNRSP